MKKTLLLLVAMLLAQLSAFAQTNTVYNRSAWTVTASSFEPTSDLPNGPAAKMLDGDNNTYWLSNYTTTYDQYPHTLVFDMQVSQPVNQITYVPRNNIGTSPATGSVSFGDDGVNFGAEIPVTFISSFAQNFINLPVTQNHRYFRITITKNHDDNVAPENFLYLTCLAEVGASLNTTFDTGLTAFTVQAQAASIQLNWTTAFENNATSYTINRSSDAVNFTPIGSVTATGTPSTPASYTFTDASPLTGTTFYRLEQVTSTLPVQKSSIKNTDFPIVDYSSTQSKNLNVFYFLPSGKAPYANFKTRMSGVMLGLQNYYKTEMQRTGYGPKTFSLVKDATLQKVKIIVVNGRFPFDNYTRDNGGGPAIQAEIDAFIAANPSSYYGNHNLTITPAFGYNPTTGIVDEQVPVYGSGRDCYTLDYPTLDYSYLGMSSVEGEAATVNIGGTAHEGGHSLGLSHNKLRVSDTLLGTALMSDGNYTYGKTTTSLTATDAAILNHNQVFNPDGITYYGAGKASIDAVHACFSASKNAIIITGQLINNGAPVTDVAIYNDPNDGSSPGMGANKDYDSVTWTVPVTGTNFYLEMPVNELQVQNGLYEMNIRLIQQDGNLTDNYYHYSLNNSVPVLNDPAFTPVTANITASAGANGSISSSGITTVNCAENQTYTITANPCFQIADVLVDGVSKGAIASYTFSNVVVNHTISVTFTASAGTTTGSETVAACGASYTWPLNGQTYNASGTYTHVVACNTATLTLTLTPSTFHSTTITECATYTWSNNGQTYTSSGTYTGTTTNCVTEMLDLTITPSTIPTLTQVASICPGSTLAALPTTSNNGVTGTWSPALNNTATTTYTFTPNANQCATTATMTITVNAAGTISGGGITVCAVGTALNLSGVSTTFTNSTTLTLNGNTPGSTVQWQRSNNYESATPTWSVAYNTTTATNNVTINGSTLTVANLLNTIWYRAKVTNGTCITYATPAKITVNQVARAGAVSSASSVCYGDNISFTSAVYTGSSIVWEVSSTSATDGFTTVAGQNGLTFTLSNINYAPLSKFYVRSVVTSGDCSIARSSVRTITVNPSVAIAGTVTGAGTFCAGSNATLRISNYTGTIQWVYSTDGNTFNEVPYNSTTLGYQNPTDASTFTTTSLNGRAGSYAVNNITGTTFFKAIVKSGTCSTVESNVVEFNTATSANAPSLSVESASICIGTATSIYLPLNIGNVRFQKSNNWSSSTPTWTNVNLPMTQTLSNGVYGVFSTGALSTSTAYRVSASIGTCAPISYGEIAVIEVVDCTINRSIETTDEIKTPFAVVAYPNPSNNVFNFKIDGANDESISILVFDMLGKQIENRTINPNSIPELQLGNNYPSGIYNVIVSQGEQTKTLRLIKK